MKNQRFLKRSKKFALGIALALGCNVLSMGMMSNAEAAVLDALKASGKVCKVKSRNVSAGHLDMIIEVRVAKEAELVKAVSEIVAVSSVSLISHDGEVTF